jgi:hypothetical protein
MHTIVRRCNLVEDVVGEDEGGKTRKEVIVVSAAATH